MSSNQQLSLASSQALAASAYDRVADPLEFVNQIGSVFHKSGACGVRSDSEGKLLALACLCERCSPFELNRRYHLIDGKLSMRADTMLAEFRARGGKHTWISDGDDGQRAEARFVYDGNDCLVSYSMDDAKRAGLTRSGSGWTRDPGAMLRARVISKGVRMLAPEVVAGVYTPEEIEDFSDSKAESPRPQKSPEELAKRRAEIQSGTAAVAVSSPAALTPPPAAAESVPWKEPPTIDVQVEPAVAPAAPATPASQAHAVAPATTLAATTSTPSTTVENNVYAVLMEIDVTLKEAGVTKDQLQAALIQKNPAMKQLEDLSIDQLKAVLANLRKKVEAARAKG